jgi:hypothetical protein
MHITLELAAWIITSQQTCDDTLEWLTPQRPKHLSNMFTCLSGKLSCFIISDAPQEL